MSPGDTASPDAVTLIGRMASAFLNRFSASNVSPDACLVDFSDNCRGKSDELSDIEYNRSHFFILGARLGTPIDAWTAGPD